MRRTFLIFVAFVPAFVTAAQASGDDAWEAFRSEVAATCLALQDAPKNAAVEVSPFGSESYGAAIVTSITDGIVTRQVCIFDKQSHKAELAAPFLAGK